MEQHPDRFASQHPELVPNLTHRGLVSDNMENLVQVGDEVKKGQAVALMGNTGRATGPNLHFEVLQDGQRVNPVPFIRRSAD